MDIDENEQILPPELPILEPKKSAVLLAQLGSDNFYEEIVRSQQVDPHITKLVTRWQFIADKAHPTGIEESFHQRYKLSNSDESQQRVLYEYHDARLAGHPGAEETLRTIQALFYWERMRKQVQEYVKGCHLCSSCKPLEPLNYTHKDPTNHGPCGTP
ncbi:uncharacterized protein LOC117181317 [Belonocnema kinseyi]|uniref:uncharacterized protein LOC117181317 n=1 Tax=Belonocnema kinseyi TaxID=2817044 RepID=UPI00143CC88F|nr:uncharacterized protein LOC117181317 [Belonocnema kinseyi]